jgi:hypothetical protein
MITYLSRSDIVALGGDRPELYVAAVRSALALHARGEFVQPLKPYLRRAGGNGHIADRIIAMPVYLDGSRAGRRAQVGGKQARQPVGSGAGAGERADRAQRP